MTRTSLIGGVIALCAAASLLWSACPSTAKTRAESRHDRRALFAAALDRLDSDHLEPATGGHGGFAWFTTRPSFNGDRELVSLNTTFAGQSGLPRFTAKRTRIRARAVMDALDALVARSTKQVTAADVAERAPIEKMSLDESDCPQIRPLLAELERLPPPTLVIPGLTAGEPEVVNVTGDGVGVVLTFNEVGTFVINPAGGYGRVTYSGNRGPAHDWVMRFKRETTRCWREEP